VETLDATRHRRLGGGHGREEPHVLHVTSIQTATRELDLSPSGGDRLAVTALAAGDVQLCNAVEFLEVENARLQVEVCECCGHRGCAQGGWVALRRCGDSVLWIPAWQAMDQRGRDANEYGPPAYLGVHGSPVFTANAWAELLRLRPTLPSAATLAPLTAREAVLLVQHAAPLQVLGHYPNLPRLRRDLLLGVADGDLEAQVDAVDHLLHAWFHSAEPVQIESGSSFFAVELLLDSMEIPTWVAFGQRDGQVALLLGASLALVCETA
jgi:hypothetical protein